MKELFVVRDAANMKNLSICIISKAPFPFPPFGQTQRMMGILKWLSKKQDVCVIAPLNKHELLTNRKLYEKMYDNCIRLGMSVVQIREFSNTFINTIFFMFQVFFAFIRTQKLKRFDILQVECTDAFFAGKILSLFFRIPVVTVFHGRAILEAKHAHLGLPARFHACLADKAAATLSDGIICTSSDVMQYAMSLGGKNDLIEVIPSGIDLEVFGKLPNKQEAREKLGIPYDSKVIIFVGHMNFPQNRRAIEYILPMFLTLKKSVNKLLLLIVGGPKIFSSTEDILVTGYVDDVLLYLSASDIAVAPFEKLAFSGGRTKILEYLAANLIVVSTPSGVDGLLDHIKEEIVLCSLKQFSERLKLLFSAQHTRMDKRSRLLDLDWKELSISNEVFLKNIIEKRKLSLSHP